LQENPGRAVAAAPLQQRLDPADDDGAVRGLSSDCLHLKSHSPLLSSPLSLSLSLFISLSLSPSSFSLSLSLSVSLSFFLFSSARTDQTTHSGKGR
jgi:hypothetical protein